MIRGLIKLPLITLKKEIYERIIVGVFSFFVFTSALNTLIFYEEFYKEISLYDYEIVTRDIEDNKAVEHLDICKRYVTHREI